MLSYRPALVRSSAQYNSQRSGEGSLLSATINRQSLYYIL